MLDGVNDLPEHARELADLLDPRGYKVNLIPYNPTGAYDGSSPERIERFRAILAEHGLDRHRPPHPRPRHRRRLRPARRHRPAEPLATSFARHSDENGTASGTGQPAS